MNIFNGLGFLNGLNKKNIALAIVVSGLLFISFLPYTQAACVPACVAPKVCVGITCVAPGDGIPAANPSGIFADVDFTDVVVNIVNWIIGFISLLGIIFLVYGGIMYVTSGGDETRAEDGKRTVTYAIIGLFIAASAYAIEKLVLTTIMG